MSHPEQEQSIRRQVRNHYAKVAQADSKTSTKETETESGGCSPGCCSIPNASGSLQLGYSSEDCKNVPQGANLGLGCGNPQAIADLRPGQVVLDLGSGGGFDCFLAAKQVGPQGQVIGVDMTPEMIDKARQNAKRSGYTQVEFRLGEIEHLPIENTSVDVILSNCVINLSPEKTQVFREAFRVLKPGGRLAIADVVAIAPLPSDWENTVGALEACVAGAVSVETLESMLNDAGFDSVELQVRPESREFIRAWFPGSGVEQYIASATIEAQKGEIISRKVHGSGGNQSRPINSNSARTASTDKGSDLHETQDSCCPPGCCQEKPSSHEVNERQESNPSCCSPECCGGESKQ